MWCGEYEVVARVFVLPVESVRKDEGASSGEASSRWAKGD